MWGLFRGPIDNKYSVEILDIAAPKNVNWNILRTALFSVSLKPSPCSHLYSEFMNSFTKHQIRHRKTCEWKKNVFVVINTTADYGDCNCLEVFFSLFFYDRDQYARHCWIMGKNNKKKNVSSYRAEKNYDEIQSWAFYGAFIFPAVTSHFLLNALCAMSGPRKKTLL